MKWPVSMGLREARDLVCQLINHQMPLALSPHPDRCVLPACSSLKDFKNKVHLGKEQVVLQKPFFPRAAHASVVGSCVYTKK